jgi:hypothetical protein
MMGTGTYSTGAARMSGIGSISCKLELFMESTSFAMQILSNIHYHPYGTMLEAFSQLNGSLYKYLMLNTEKLLELHSVTAIRIADNCLPAYRMCRH